jgi:hypothetical protein
MQEAQRAAPPASSCLRDLLTDEVRAEVTHRSYGPSDGKSALLLLWTRIAENAGRMRTLSFYTGCLRT